MSGPLTARWESAFMGNYATPTLALVRGEGVTVWDAAGREYIDCIAGIAVSILGHGHPAVVEAVTRQVGTLAHTSNLVANLPALSLAERLRDLAGQPGARVFLCNSGSEANEAAIKVVRRHWDGARTRIVSTMGSFHGRTLGALSLTGQPTKQAPFAPLLPDIHFVPFGDADALAQAVDDRTAALFLEPVQGENGVLPAPAGYLEAARSVCDATGALLVLDEIQGAMGRTGSFFAHQTLAPGVAPDLITMAKGLAGGLPIGACLAVGAPARAFQPGDHGSTFGGNPVACAAALAVLDTLVKDDLAANAVAMGDRLAAGITGLRAALVRSVRGVGLWRAVLLTAPVAAAVEQAAREAGLLVNAVKPDTLRLAPALVISPGEVDAAVTALGSAVGIALGTGIGPTQKGS
jgi:acetylornithine/N-succinyldiaminopimelate aminotransferase